MSGALKGVVLALAGEEDESEPFVAWLRCYACGHWLAYAATDCPQCDEPFDDREAPAVFPELCECERCNRTREGAM